LQQSVQADEQKLDKLVKAEKALKARLEELRRQQEEKERRERAERERLAKIKAEQERQRRLEAQRLAAEQKRIEEQQRIAAQQRQVGEQQRLAAQQQRVAEQQAKVAQQQAAARNSAKASSNGYGGLSTGGNLRWPVQGPILISYGSPRTAELKWKGTLIGASEGTQVKAVAPGQVVYADWLDGFGMLLVIDHGKGYMSLYGHNQSLLRQVGQKVEQGNPWPGRRQRRTGADPASTSRSAIRARPSTRPSGWPDARPALAVPEWSPLLSPALLPRGNREQKTATPRRLPLHLTKSLHRAGFLLGRRHHTARPDDENLPLFHPAQGKTTSPICSSSPCC
jgi:biotin carboxyl carrier protein